MKQNKIFKNFKKKTTSLHGKLFRYFLLFTALLLVITWVFQSTLLETTYRRIRSNQIISAGKEFANQFEQETFEDNANTISIEKNMCVIVINLNTNKLMEVNKNLINSLLNQIDVQKLTSIVRDQYTGDEMIFYVDEIGSKIVRYNEPKMKFNDSIKALIYVNQIKNSDNETLMIITIGSIVPVETIISTMRYQTLNISIIMVILSLIISFFVSKLLTKPLTSMSSKAKQLAKGDFNTNFESSNILEINDLSNSLNQMTTDLSKVDKMQKDLIANISHDLRTPLTMISGYGELIRDIPDENNAENIQVIIDEANRLASLVNNLLDISKLQSGSDNISIDDVNINQLIFKVCDSFNKMLESKGYRIEFNPEEDDCYVKCDNIRIQQVIYNLLNNAINHCGDDNTVIIKTVHENNELTVHIIDHGEGIPENELANIWNRYYKAKNKGRCEVGSGLGLSIVKTILDLHNAKYGVASKVKEGSDFYFTLKLSDNQ